MSPSEVNLLTSITSGERVVECGSLIGVSTILLASKASKVVSIDKHEGYGPPTFRRFMSNIQKVGTKVTPIVGDVRKYLPKIEAEVALIDLLGTFDLTKWCLDNLHPSIMKVAIHDTHRTKCDGVEKAIQASLSTWEPFGQADTLTVLRRR